MDQTASDDHAVPCHPAWAWHATLSGLCASLVGIGLARFAYTPLLPAIVDAHWFAASTAAYLGAANLAGYLAGALLGRPLAQRVPTATVIRAMMVLATVTFFACAVPLSFTWFFLWRLAAGLAGGALMVLAAPAVLPHVAPSRRGLAAGVIFTGVGLGIAASGTLVPILLRQGLTATWLGLGILALMLTLVAWRGWPDGGAVATRWRGSPRSRQGTVTLRALYGEYALNAAGLVPHMIFLVDFVARGLGQGVARGAEYWVLFGLGAMMGPLLGGHLADRIGFGAALRCAYVVEALAVVVPVLTPAPGWLMLSSVIVGGFTPGIVPLVLGRIHELLAPDPAAQQAAWGVATTGFATFQALGAYGMSFLFARGGDDRLLFLLGAVAMALALALDLAAAVGARRDPAAT
ncbi:MAG: YbfB/YjiJ family MFS transporter [Azospirillaceae bacterium]|nr:YbfB/YjiJ family MFS transporter [Azospirillaceae bacterium]